mgnify:CR=1 FL=1
MNKIILLSLLATGLFACANTPKKQTTEITQQSQKPSVQALNSTDLPEALLNENVVLIDVRTPDEVANGYIKEAHKFIDINGNSFESEIDKLDKSKTYIMYCRSGGRSGRAAQHMIDNGFSNVFNLTGGITNYSGELAK